MSRFKLGLAGAAVLGAAMAAGAPAHAGFMMNGFMMNGFMMNGFMMNGLRFNGTELRGGLPTGAQTAPGAIEAGAWQLQGIVLPDRRVPATPPAGGR